jgi:hypothetical protein
MDIGGKAVPIPVKSLHAHFATVGPVTHTFQLTLKERHGTLGADIVEYVAGTYVVAMVFSSIGKPPLTTVGKLVQLSIDKLLTATFTPSTTTTTDPTAATSTTAGA